MPPKNLAELTSKTYVDQAKFYLNGFWDEGAKEEAEKIRAVTLKFIELDPKKEKGTQLDEFGALKLMESQGESLSAPELRNMLKTIDADRSGGMALIEYLLYVYKKTVDAALKSPQGSSTHEEEINKAAAKLQEVTDASAQVQAQLEAQNKALADQKSSEEKARNDLDASTKAAAKAKEDEAAAQQAESSAKSQLEGQQAGEEKIKAAEADLQKAIDAIKSQEDAHAQAIAELEKKCADESLSAVQRNKANAELGQLKSKDLGDVRQQKIKQEAIIKKITADRTAAEAATKQATDLHNSAQQAARQAEASAKAAEEAKTAASGSAAAAQSKREELEAQTKRVEEAQRDTEARSAEASAKLTELKGMTAVAHGAVWWMEREVQEAQKYLPKKK